MYLCGSITKIGDVSVPIGSGARRIVGLTYNRETGSFSFDENISKDLNQPFASCNEVLFGEGSLFVRTQSQGLQKHTSETNAWNSVIHSDQVVLEVRADEYGGVWARANGKLDDTRDADKSSIQRLQGDGTWKVLKEQTLIEQGSHPINQWLPGKNGDLYLVYGTHPDKIDSFTRSPLMERRAP